MKPGAAWIVGCAVGLAGVAFATYARGQLSHAERMLSELTSARALDHEARGALAARVRRLEREVAAAIELAKSAAEENVQLRQTVRDLLERQERASEPPPEVPSTTATSTLGPGPWHGAVVGTVSITGPRPDPVMITISSDPVLEAEVGASQVVDPKFQVNADLTLPNAFVWASKGPHRSLPPATSDATLVLRQRGGLFEPRVFGVVTKQSIEARGSLGTMCCVNVRSRRNMRFNCALDDGEGMTLSFAKKEKAIAFTCDVHSWTRAYCFVLYHPFFTTTDARGAFRIEGLPDGEYSFGVWHEHVGETKFKATVRDGAAVATSVTLTQ